MYRYIGIELDCRYNASAVTPVRPTGSQKLQQNANAYKAALANGPIAALVEADKVAFRFYSSGILNSDKCGYEADHAVQIVGWGKDESSQLEYYIVKNSWGGLWGEDGYIRIAIAVGPTGMGICGIHNTAYVPTF